MRYFKDREYLLSFLIGAGLLAAAIAINSYAVRFATESVSNSVTDIVLDNTPVVDVDVFFVYGAVVLVLIIAFFALARPQRAPFIMKATALFTVIRSFFVSLTHINPYPQHVFIEPNFITNLFPSIFTGKDLFFSGHVGIPFLLALIFWDEKPIRYLFLAFTVMFAIVVLLGHLHYSIDVAAAFFITFTIFTLAKVFFAKDWERFTRG